MAVATERKQELVKSFRRSDGDTGSAEVQVALLTERINLLSEHFKLHKKDEHGRRGLVTIVNQRRKLLDYLARTDHSKYTTLIKKLEIRK